MTKLFQFDNQYSRLPEQMFTRIAPMPVQAPKLLAFNDDLAEQLGMTASPSEAELAELFSGNRMLEGAKPISQLYAGHQFGGFSPQLGDGRAHLLGELVTPLQKRFDLQLKGSGPTPYSRMGDGRAWLGPVLREYVISEAMSALGIPTSRSLAAVATGELVYRERAFPGAVLTRIASSHVRIGHFEAYVARNDRQAAEALFGYVRERHYPEADTPLKLLEEVIAAQSKLVAKWMAVGFIHGVMNTDNTTISGETIDYGPCAFIEAYRPDQVYSSIDQSGRYSYQNQPKILPWNLSCLGSALLILEKDPASAIPLYQQAINGMAERIETEWEKAFSLKLGLKPNTPQNRDLIEGFLKILHDNSIDFTNGFRALTDLKYEINLLEKLPSYSDWSTKWKELRSENWQEIMDVSNPWIIPRNHQVERMIAQALEGDFALFERLNRALKNPFTPQHEFEDLRVPASPDEQVQATFCGT